MNTTICDFCHTRIKLGGLTVKDHAIQDVTSQLGTTFSIFPGEPLDFCTWDCVAGYATKHAEQNLGSVKA